MLDAHPKICCFGEFEYAVKYASGDAHPNMQRLKRLLANDRVFTAHGFSTEESQDARSLANSCLSQAGERFQKSIVGATVHSRFDLLSDLCPEAKFIHLIRDPRDVANSCIGMGWVGNVWYGSNYWLDAERRWSRFVRKLSEDQYLEVRYEDLITGANDSLGRICEFLGTSFDEQMLEYDAETTYSKPDPNLVNQWRRKMTLTDIELIEAKCNELMQNLGYSLTTEARLPSKSQQWKLLVNNRIGRSRFNINRYGLSFYVKMMAAKRLGRFASDWQQRIHHKQDQVDIAHLK